MSLGIVIKGPEGLVLAAESRVTLTAEREGGSPIFVNFDNATKLLTFSHPNAAVGAVTYGQAAIGLRTAHSFIPEFESVLPPNKRLACHDFAKHLSDFFARQWKDVMPPDYSGPDMTFVVGGFDQDEPYGRVFQIDVPRHPIPVECIPGEFGIVWGGQREFVDRLIQGYDHNVPEILRQRLGLRAQQVQSVVEALRPLQMPIPFAALPLQDCVDLAIFFIRTTMGAQKLSVGIRGVGGPIDVAIITRREGLQFVQRKQIAGESPYRG